MSARDLFKESCAIFCEGILPWATAPSTRYELKMFNSVVAANSELKQITTHQLMSHLIKTSELGLMFPNLTKLAAIGLLLPISSVDCERGFSTLSL